MNINELLNIKYPILQGGMAHIATGEFAATLSNAGALGTIGSGGMSPQRLKREIEICQSLTDRPFAVNLMMLRPDIREIIDIVLESGVKIVTAGAGSPGPFMKELEEAGILVFPVISSPIQAKKLSKYKLGGIIAEGMEAGGHIGEMTTMVLVPQAKEATDLPLISGGGIASGKQMLAAEILGAQGVQIGTAFLLTEECPIHEEYKKSLLKATASKVTTVGNINGLPMRILKNNMAREYKKLEKEESNIETLETFTVGRLREAVVNGDVINGSVMTGYTVGQLDRILPVKDFIEQILGEYEEAKKCLLK
ncbi:nitronate monooxygenase [Peptoniphilus sp. KCTC 25270]|uniref:NAD(P)H-dependent flavin oxidoreductase n=1 Tax=Peptoniphilus sp. KCTC 25270 TaxID=2897414 RepID=UPI001E394A52|nr:nitronate monooxygenase [Peptoniphilus sp. KCTC 25270]MCD1147710.1 nitronate monooxygenase [Peptoniphilus sp. KCTC 25270]